MNLALIYGGFATKGRSPYDVNNLHKLFLTGSESFFFNMAQGLSERGHAVDAYGPWSNACEKGNLLYIPYRLDWSSDEHHSRCDAVVKARDVTYDAVIAWNEPDYISTFKANKKVCVQQLNDFSYCHGDYQNSTDLFLLASQDHLDHTVKLYPSLTNKCRVFSNCINRQEAMGDLNLGVRDHSIAYISSPDRGLHWLCEMFPKIRKQVPDVTMSVYYEYRNWYELVKSGWGGTWLELGFRARYTHDFFSRMGTGGENGVFLQGPRPSEEVAKMLQKTRLLVYPCDTISFTEGFGVAVLDACYAGCLPVISDVDAFGSVYGGTAEMIPGRPGNNREKWVSTVVRCLKDDDYVRERIKVCRKFAEKFTRQAKAEELEGHLRD